MNFVESIISLFPYCDSIYDFKGTTNREKTFEILNLAKQVNYRKACWANYLIDFNFYINRYLEGDLTLEEILEEILIKESLSLNTLDKINKALNSKLLINIIASNNDGVLNLSKYYKLRFDFIKALDSLTTRLNKTVNDTFDLKNFLNLTRVEPGMYDVYEELVNYFSQLIPLAMIRLDDDLNPEKYCYTQLTISNTLKSSLIDINITSIVNSFPIISIHDSCKIETIHYVLSSMHKDDLYYIKEFFNFDLLKNNSSEYTIKKFNEIRKCVNAYS